MRTSRPVKELPAVGAERALKVLSGRWKLLLVWHLSKGALRLRDIESAVPDASQKVLLDQLRELEAHGLILRTVDDGPPVKVTYVATHLGRTIEPLILELCAWGRRHERATSSQTAK